MIGGHKVVADQQGEGEHGAGLDLRRWVVRHQPALGRGLVRDLYRMIIEPSVSPDASITHLVFCGLDGYRSVVSIKDALAQDLLIGERLNGALLDADHGAPVRLVSPNQYGYVSIKHLSRIELHTAEPTGVHASPALRLLKPHPRARVWDEERHRYLPAWSVRHIYRLLSRPIAVLSARRVDDCRDR